MPIVYPINAQSTTTTTTTVGNGYFNYAIGFFDPNNGPFITTGSAYTSSFDVSAYVIFVDPSTPSGSTINIAVPTSSYQVESGSFGEILINPAIEFWRIDQNADVTVKLVTNTGSVGFTNNIAVTSSFYTIPTSSYNSLVNVPGGMGGTIYYLMLEKSQLPNP